jgi:Putative peptidoglycan binding domain
MSNYPLLLKSNRLPAVGVLQKLLNRGGAGLTVDGNFGDRTRRAVIDFQRPRGLKHDGIVGVATWPRVSAGANLPIMDCVDILDPLLLEDTETPIKRVGGNPRVIGGMCNGVEQAIVMILAASPGNVFLLRFHGHGAPGEASVSSGRGELDPHLKEQADIWASPVILNTLSRLKGIFGRYGCIQFMHCQTGRGSQGHLLLSKIASALGVPATAAVNDQSGLGFGNLPFGYTGPTVTAVPHGGTLAGWARSLPEFPGVSVP